MFKNPILRQLIIITLSFSPVAMAASIDINGKNIECKHANDISTDGTKIFANSPAEAIPASGQINYNAKYMNKFSTEAQAWVLCHECGHLDNNQNEMSADSYGLACAVKHNLNAKKVVDDACGFLANAPATAHHPAGSTRCENLRRAQQCMDSAGGDNSSCLQANGDPSGAGGKTAEGGGGSSMSPQLAALAQQMSSAWVAQENQKHQQQPHSQQQPQPQKQAQAADQSQPATPLPITTEKSSEKLGHAGFMVETPAKESSRSSAQKPDEFQVTPSSAQLNIQSADVAEDVRLAVPIDSSPLSNSSPEGFSSRGPAGQVMRTIPASASAPDVSRQLGPSLFRISTLAYESHCQQRKLTTCAPEVLSDGMR